MTRIEGRGVCPSCNTRRMAEVATHLTDEVIPYLSVRQWVLSVPKRLRPVLHQSPEVASALLGILLRALSSALLEASPGAPAALRDVQLGAISFPQRFGSSLNPHYHYHVLALDGVVSGDVELGVRFHEATGLAAQDAEALARTVQLHVLRWFTRRGLLDSATAAGMRTWQGTGGVPWTAPSALRARTGRVWSASFGTARAGLSPSSGSTPPPLSGH